MLIFDGEQKSRMQIRNMRLHFCAEVLITICVAELIHLPETKDWSQLQLCLVGNLLQARSFFAELPEREKRPCQFSIYNGTLPHPT